jgi:SET domain-containing protein
VNFNYLTPSWYLNEPPTGSTASVAADADLNFFACRDIEEGEELTIVYSTFSEPIDPRAGDNVR